MLCKPFTCLEGPGVCGAAEALPTVQTYSRCVRCSLQAVLRPVEEDWSKPVLPVQPWLLPRWRSYLQAVHLRDRSC